MRPVVVKWYDSHFGHGGWRPLEYATEEHLSVCESCGWLMRENDSELMLVLTLTDDSYADSMLIPKGCIIEIVELKEVQ